MKVINMIIPYVRYIEPNNNLIYLQIKGGSDTLVLYTLHKMGDNAVWYRGILWKRVS